MAERLPVSDLRHSLSPDQRRALSRLADDLAHRADLSEKAKADLLARRTADYLGRNVERDVRRGHDPTATLAAQAQQVRVDAERARILHAYSRDVRRGRAKPPPSAEDDDTPPTSVLEPAARYRLECIDCSSDIRLFRPEPRVPLCERCKRRRATATAKQREARRARVA
jgi:hypothetical protein